MSIKHFKILLVIILKNEKKIKRGEQQITFEGSQLNYYTHILTGHTNTVMNNTNEQKYEKLYIY
jgi:hypothetical protein